MDQKIAQAQAKDLTYFVEKRPIYSPETATQSRSPAVPFGGDSFPALRAPAENAPAKVPPI